MLAPGSGRQAIQKKAYQIWHQTWVSNLATLREQEKQKTDQLHWVTHRGGLGAAN